MLNISWWAFPSCLVTIPRQLKPFHFPGHDFGHLVGWPEPLFLNNDLKRFNKVIQVLALMPSLRNGET